MYLCSIILTKTSIFCVMSSWIVLLIIAFYFVTIFFVSWITTRKQQKDDKRSFFVGDRKSPWYVVAIAMIGTSISGVTYVSVPGMVAGSQFSYMQMVLGFVAGYFAVAYILLPLYYRLNLCSIYGYLEQRYGLYSYRTGSAFFLISKFLGCAVRMYLTAVVLQLVLFDGLGIPFAGSVALIMLIVWLYTFRGGVKTLVWTDLLQTMCLILAMVFFIYFVCKTLGLSAAGLYDTISESEWSRTWFFDDPNDKRYFWKQFFAGMFTTIAMTGLDQDMMQKNLSCKSLKEAQKNMVSYGFGFLPVNIIFLSLGILLYKYATELGMLDGTKLMSLEGKELVSDELFPYLATGTNPLTGEAFLPLAVSILFVMGLIAAAFSSAGSAVTALTTSFTVDMLRADKKQDATQLKQTRFWVHLVNTILMGCMIYLFSIVGSGSVINAVYVVASYTYGPLIGLYFFGLYTKIRPRDRFVPFICLLSPILCFILSTHSEEWFNGYKIGYELLLINGGITALGLYLSSITRKKPFRP